MDRRSFLSTTSALGLAAVAPPRLERRRPAVRAVLFDAFPIFDPRPVGDAAEELFPGRGPALMAAWRSRQFEYTWIRTTARQYRDFWQVTDDALVAAARALELELGAEARQTLTTAYLRLRPWPDVRPGLARLREAGIRVGLLSNFTLTMLETNLAAADLRGAFHYVLSTDQAQAFKPSPEAYRLGLHATGLDREQIAFAAFAPWDAAGARWFGYHTVWVNRSMATPEELGSTPDASGHGFEAVTDLVLVT